MSFSIKGNGSTIEKGEFDTFTVDTKNNNFELAGEDASSNEVPYKHSDGGITVDISGTEHEYYKKGNDAYDNELNKFNQISQ